MIALSPLSRRIVYVATYELLAIGLSTLLLMLMSGGRASDSAPVAVAVSVIAVVWNYVFNYLFEAWERNTHRLSRTVCIRAVHACMFEIGLILFTIPIYMWWYDVGVIQALTMEAVLLAFFLAYTFLFTWSFDLMFVRAEQRQRQVDCRGQGECL